MNRACRSPCPAARPAATRTTPCCMNQRRVLFTRRLSPNVRGVDIRPATGSDWPAIYPIFREIVEAGETYAYPQGLSSSDAQSWWLEPPPVHVVVAVDADAVVGTAKMGPNRPGRGSHVATASFMVDPSYGG